METLTFQAETGQLLDLVVHSLYTQRDVFLRELISNASDALDRLRFEALSRPELQPDSEPLEILLEVDPVARTLTVRDNGIGMSRQEVIDNIGTIARSGTKELLDRLKSEDREAHAIALIGRFGVGFYSSFMVADHVVLTTRRADESTGIRWESSGTVQYTIEDVESAPRGTAITLHLKEVDREGGIEDYCDRWVLARIVKQFADYVAYPIAYVGPDEVVDGDPSQAGAPTRRIVLNSMRPIWTRPEADVSAEEYARFYFEITQDPSPPLLRMSFNGEGRWEYAARLFVPSRAPYDLFYQGCEYGLQMYSQRMLIVKHSKDLLPRYLRFLKGVVDVGDLALHISRQALQHSHHLEHIRKWLTRKAIDHLANLRDTDPEQYLTFWREFGRAFKEGVSEDYANKDRLLPLMLFESSADKQALTTLSGYVSRMPPNQKDILYIVSESRAAAEHAPQLEQFLARGYEVLFLTEPVDELLVRAVPQFEGKSVRSVAQGEADLAAHAESDEGERSLEERVQALSPLIEFLSKELEARVRSVRASERLSVSPACLVGDAHEFSPVTERLLMRGKGGVPAQRRVMEINPQHPIVQAMQIRLARDAADPLLRLAAQLLLGFSFLAEGSQLPDPVAFTVGLTDFLSHVLPVPHAPDDGTQPDAASDAVDTVTA